MKTCQCLLSIVLFFLCSCEKNHTTVNLFDDKYVDYQNPKKGQRSLFQKYTFPSQVLSPDTRTFTPDTLILEILDRAGPIFLVKESLKRRVDEVTAIIDEVVLECSLKDGQWTIGKIYDSTTNTKRSSHLFSAWVPSELDTGDIDQEITANGWLPLPNGGCEGRTIGFVQNHPINQVDIGRINVIYPGSSTHDGPVCLLLTKPEGALIGTAKLSPWSAFGGVGWELILSLST